MGPFVFSLRTCPMDNFDVIRRFHTVLKAFKKSIYLPPGFLKEAPNSSKIGIFCFLNTAVTNVFKQNRPILEIFLRTQWVAIGSEFKAVVKSP